jgi:hypothetical protein
MRGRLGVVAIVIALAAAACSSSSHPAASTATSGPTTTIAPSGPVPATGALPWPAPADALAHARAAGLTPRPFETLEHHVHAHLDVFLDRSPITVPAGIGINIHDPAVHRLAVDGQPAYGAISPACKQACISPLHTHDVTGILHTESPTNVDNTLGEFFIEWGVTLNTNCVGGYCRPAWKIAIYVDGHDIGSADPRAIRLTNHKEIAIVIGVPPAQIPSKGDFSQV